MTTDIFKMLQVKETMCAVDCLKKIKSALLNVQAGLRHSIDECSMHARSIFAFARMNYCPISLLLIRPQRRTAAAGRQTARGRWLLQGGCWSLTGPARGGRLAHRALRDPGAISL